MFSKVRVPITCTIPHVAKRLSNGVNVVIVEDKSVTKPAAAMAFNVGKYNDPPEFPGLAHFCEHMLFMGTAKYPSEDAYQTAVKRNGGSCNAFTSHDTTCYHFNSSLASYKAIVDMFLEFFIAPSFNVSAVERELNAVNSEDERNHTNDYRRVEEMLMTNFVAKEHPRSRYGSGNLVTLKHDPAEKGLNVHDALRGFFDSYYVAEGSCLVLYSPFSAEEMLEIVEPTLLKIKSGTIPPHTFVPDGAMLDPSKVGRWCNVLTTTKQRRLRLTWTLPFGNREYMRAPWSYLSHMLGHEVKGTIIAALRIRGLATELSAGGHAYDLNNAEFSINITLTDKGVACLEDVFDVVFQYIELMRRCPGGASDPRIVASYEEMKVEQQARFEYSELGRPADHCSHIACSTLVVKDPALALCGNVLSEESGLEGAFAALNEFLIPERCVVVLGVGESADLAAAAKSEKNAAFFAPDGADDTDASSAVFSEKNISFPETTRFHKMPYAIAKLPKAFLTRWSKAALAALPALDPLLHLPAPNPFLTKDFSVFGEPNASKIPSKVETAYGYALLKRSEAHLHNQPKLYALLNVMLAPSWWEAGAAVVDRRKATAEKYYREIMVNAIDEALIDMTYFADLAGLKIKVSSNVTGLVLTSEGPSASLPSSLVRFLSELLDYKFLTFNSDLFGRHAKKKLLGLRGTCEMQPTQLAMLAESNLFSSDSHVYWEDLHAFAEKGEAAPSSSSAAANYFDYPSYEGYCEFVKTSLFANGVRTELIVDGNFASDASIKADLSDKIDAVLSSFGLRAVPPSAIPPYNNFFVPSTPSVIVSSSPLFHQEECCGCGGGDAEKEAVTEKAKATAPVATPPFYLINLPAFSKTNVNAATIVKIYLGPATPERYPLVRLMGNIIGSPFFNTLRSVETLGYAVHAQVGATTHRECFALFAIQSPVASPLYLFSRIYAFLDAFCAQVLEGLSQEAIDGAIMGLVQTLKQPTTTVSSDGTRVVGDRFCPHGFDWRKKELAFLLRGRHEKQQENQGQQEEEQQASSAYTKEDLVALFKEYMANDSPTRKAVAIFVNSDKIDDAAFAESLKNLSCVPLPVMRKKKEEEEKEAATTAAAAASSVSASADTKIVMRTFEGDSAVNVSFIPLISKAEVHSISTVHEVPIN